MIAHSQNQSQASERALASQKEDPKKGAENVDDSDSEEEQGAIHLPALSCGTPRAIPGSRPLHLDCVIRCFG